MWQLSFNANEKKRGDAMISLYDPDQLNWFHTDIGINMNHGVLSILYTIKPAHAVTSIKQPPVLKGHIFLVLSQRNIYELNLF